MSEDIDIADIDGFPSKIEGIRTAAATLRDLCGELTAIVDTATGEASVFTRDGAQAPIYTEALNGLLAWGDAAATLTRTLAANAESCANTAEFKFNGITGADDLAASAISST